MKGNVYYKIIIYTKKCYILTSSHLAPALDQICVLNLKKKNRCKNNFLLICLTAQMGSHKKKFIQYQRKKYF